MALNPVCFYRELTTLSCIHKCFDSLLLILALSILLSQVYIPHNIGSQLLLPCCVHGFFHVVVGLGSHCRETDPLTLQPHRSYWRFNKDSPGLQSTLDEEGHNVRHSDVQVWGVLGFQFLQVEARETIQMENTFR